MTWVKNAEVIRILGHPNDNLMTYLYEIPLYVVPTSNASTNFRREPPNAERGTIVNKLGNRVACGRLLYLGQGVD